MSDSAELSKPAIEHDNTTESEGDCSDTDFDPEEIEKEIMGVKSLLRRQCARHKVSECCSIKPLQEPLIFRVWHCYNSGPQSPTL